jgi:HSP20 family molecular chaperone IbpA
LPNGLNTDKLEANLHDGVLDVRIAVAEAMKPRKIEIAAEPSHKVIAA